MCLKDCINTLITLLCIVVFVCMFYLYHNLKQTYDS